MSVCNLFLPVSKGDHMSLLYLHSHPLFTSKLSLEVVLDVSAPLAMSSVDQPDVLLLVGQQKITQFGLPA